MGLPGLGDLLSGVTSGGGLLGGLTQMIEDGVEKLAKEAGLPPEAAEALGDVARLGTDYYTGNVMDAVGQVDDLADDAQGLSQLGGPQSDKRAPIQVGTLSGRSYEYGPPPPPYGPPAPGQGGYDPTGTGYGAYVFDGAWRLGSSGGHSYNGPIIHDHSRAGDFTDYFRSNAGPPPAGSTDKGTWDAWIKSANGEDIEKAISSGVIPKEILDDQALMTQMQTKMQSFSRLTSFLKSVLDADHDTKKGLSQFRV